MVNPQPIVVTNPDLSKPGPNKPKAQAGAPTTGAATVSPKSIPVLPKRSLDSFQACALIFLTGPYTGQTLDLGMAIPELSHSQGVNWEEQKGRSTRTGLTFSNVSPRSITMRCQFFSLNEDVTELAENLMTLGELDEKTGIPGTLLYVEGSMKIQPLVCDGNITIDKSNPLNGQKGYRLANVTVPLKLGGGKTSEHRLAEPLVETALTRWKKAKTDAEKAREGKLQASKLTLADCLTQSENDQLSALISEGKLKDPNEVSKLSGNALAQAAIGGLIPASVLKNQSAKLTDAIAAQIAQSTNGVGTHAGSLQAAILGRPHVLPPDLSSQVSLLKSQHTAIVEAAISQNLTPNSPVFSDAATAATLTRSMKCGIRLLAQGAPPKNANQESAAKETAYFVRELNQNSNDLGAQEKLIAGKVNAKIADKTVKDAEIQKLFGLTSTEQVKALRNAIPFKDKDDFVNRLGTQSIVGLKSWDSYKEILVNAGT